jgi:hypothetical protein
VSCPRNSMAFAAGQLAVFQGATRPESALTAEINRDISRMRRFEESFTKENRFECRGMP